MVTNLSFSPLLLSCQSFHSDFPTPGPTRLSIVDVPECSWVTICFLFFWCRFIIFSRVLRLCHHLINMNAVLTGPLKKATNAFVLNTPCEWRALSWQTDTVPRKSSCTFFEFVTFFPIFTSSICWISGYLLDFYVRDHSKKNRKKSEWQIIHVFV